MKSKNKILYPLLGIILLFLACSPDKYELGALMNKSDLKFTVVSSSTNPNNIVLTSLTPGVTPVWITPYGRSLRVQDTVNVAFPGVYKFKYGVESDGGFVQSDSVLITVNTIDEKAVAGSMWKNLVGGGLGNEKTWYLDLDANGISKLWAGPLYFYGTQDSWTTLRMLESGMSTTQIKAALGLTDVWNWKPTWSGNKYLCAAADFGSLTFNLKDGPYVKSDHTSTADGLTMGGVQNGTYMLDTINHTINFTNVTIIHPIIFDINLTKSWTGMFKVLTLTPDKMQIGVLRDPTLSGASACLDVFNFVSKNYYDTH